MTPATLGSLAPLGREMAAAASSAAPCTATIAWRVGRGSMLEVAFGWSACRDASDTGAHPASILIRTNAVDLAVPRDAHATATIDAVTDAGEIGFLIDLGGDRGVAALRLVTLGRGHPPVVVTDLPERLGLRGGTYTIERVEA